ncbi:MAG: DNA repair protein RadC [Pseudomonadota bacterium]
MSQSRSSFSVTKDGRYQFDEPVSRETLVAISQSIIREKFSRLDTLRSSDDSKEFVKSEIGDEDKEVFLCIFLDNKNGVISSEILFTGTVSQASVYTREVVKRALELNAVALIVAHNHPSGDSEPSHADIKITTRLKHALALVDIRVLDHLIVGGDGTSSLANLGHL